MTVFNTMYTQIPEKNQKNDMIELIRSTYFYIKYVFLRYRKYLPINEKPLIL